MSQGLFGLGQTLATPGALDLGVNLQGYILRHVSGDWGTVGRFDQTDLTAEEDARGMFATADDAKLNVVAIRHGGRVLSAYETPKGRLWVITDGLDAGGNSTEDTVTTCLLPSEY